jgi:protein tyrosine phosphatase (PTP) superfamily phosphohydrolase (DUF442 family)
MDISQITDYLFVGAEPCHDDVTEIQAQNVRLVISMMGERRPHRVFDESPLGSLWLPSYDTFFTPISITNLIKGVESAQKVIQSGARVLVHCQQGRHRSVIMAAAILIANGHSAEQAMTLLSARRQIADPRAWYVRRQIHRFEKYWHAKTNSRDRYV